MAFKMNVESITGGKIVPPGLYDVQLTGFKPKFSKNKDSVNFNAQMTIVNHPEYDGVKIFESLNTKAGFMQAEFAHAFGVQMEDQGNGQYALPGFWDGDISKFKEDDPSTWVYEGPLLKKVAKVEIATRTYEGKEGNAIKKYICALPPAECAAQGVKHSDDLLRKS